MEEKDQTVNTTPQSQEQPSSIEDKQDASPKEGDTSPVTRKTVPMIPHDRKVTFRKKQSQEDHQPASEQDTTTKAAAVKYVKKDEANQEEEDKRAYVDMKPHDKKFVYQKKGIKLEKQAKSEPLQKQEHHYKPDHHHYQSEHHHYHKQEHHQKQDQHYNHHKQDHHKQDYQSEYSKGEKHHHQKGDQKQKSEQHERPVSLSRSIMRQNSFDFKPKPEEKKKKEQDSSPDKKAKPTYVKKAAVAMNFEQLEQYFASQPKQRASSFSSTSIKTSTQYRLPPGLQQNKSNSPFNFQQPVGGLSRPLILPNNPPAFKPGPVKLKVQAHSFSPSEGIDLAQLVTKAPSFTPQS